MTRYKLDDKGVLKDHTDEPVGSGESAFSKKLWDKMTTKEKGENSLKTKLTRMSKDERKVKPK